MTTVDDLVEHLRKMIHTKDTQIAKLRAALEWMRDRDDRNGSLPQAYRDIIDAALITACTTNAGRRG